MRARFALGLTAVAMAAATTGLQVPAASAAVAHPAARAGQAQRAASSSAATSSPAPYVSARQAPSWQANNTVWAIAQAKGVLYVGGEFTSVRPPGARPGSGEVARSYLAAFSASTGALITSFNAPVSGGAGSEVTALAVSPDGKTLYVGGLFNHVDGQYRDNLAAVSTSTGALTGWAPPAFGKVNAIAPSGSKIYIGGSFNELAGQTRTFAGAVDSAGGLLPWAPVLSDSVTSIAVASGDSQVLIGGYFQTINGVAENAAGAVDPATGQTTEPWSANIVPATSHCNPPAVKTIVISGSTAYLGSEGTGGGCFDGDFAVNLSAGRGGIRDTLAWQNDCLGATQALVVIDGYLYKGSHAHDCAYAPGGFPQNPEELGVPLVTYHLLNQSLADGTLGHWTPNTNATLLGPRVMATDGHQLFLGGDFTTVNGRGQQGLARFPAGPDPTYPVPPAAPTVTSPAKGVAELTFTAISTSDVGTLTYAVYQSGHRGPIGQFTATSWPWARPVLHFRATGLRPGARYQFTVTDSDGTRTSGKSPASAPATIATQSPAISYQALVLRGQPSFFWLLNQASGHVAADSSPHHFNGIYERGTSLRAPGPISGSRATATSFNGTTGLVTSATAVSSPARFSVDAWFRTTTNTGGKIIGFGSKQTGMSSSYDRQIYMMNDGQLVFGMATPQREVILTPNVYNDGQWHHVVATFSPTASSGTMTLYVDGQRVGTQATGLPSAYTGYWRVGSDNLNGWNLDIWGSNSQGTTEPNSYHFRGSIGAVAVYPYALSAAQVARQYAVALSR